MDEYINLNKYIYDDKISEKNELGEINEEYFFYNEKYQISFIKKRLNTHK